MNFALKLCILSSGDDNTDSGTRPQCIQNLVTHAMTDKVAYLSEVTLINFFPYCLLLHTTDYGQKYNTHIISRPDAIHLQTGFKPLFLFFHHYLHYFHSANTP